MLKSSIESLEGKQTIGVLLAGAFGIYYILRSQKPELPPIEELLSHIEGAKEMAQVYSTIYSPDIPKVSNAAGAFDFGAIGGILVLMYKIFGNFNTGRVDLKKEEFKLKIEELKLKAEELKVNQVAPTTVNTAPITQDSSKPKF